MRRWSVPARTSMRFRMQENMMAWSACSAGWKRFARCNATDFGRGTSIELLLLTSEEPTRFGIGCIGSRMLSGALPAEAARKLKDAEGASVDEVRRAAGMHWRAGGSASWRAAITKLGWNCISSRGRCWNESACRWECVTKIAAPASCANHDRRLGRTRGRSIDARPARRSVRRVGTDSCRRKCGANDRRHRQRRVPWESAMFFPAP